MQLINRLENCFIYYRYSSNQLQITAVRDQYEQVIDPSFKELEFIRDNYYAPIIESNINQDVVGKLCINNNQIVKHEKHTL